MVQAAFVNKVLVLWVICWVTNIHNHRVLVLQVVFGVTKIHNHNIHNC